MTDDSDNRHAAALAMLDAFASVGTTSFDLTWTTSAGDKDGFRRGVRFGELRRKLTAMIDTASTTQRNVIVRPRGTGLVAFIQLDDLNADKLKPLAPAVFLALETSPGNFQAWVALHGVEDKDFARRLRKGTGADTTASGATRVAGSLNFKAKYAPDYPRIRIHAVQPRRIAKAGELEQLGLVAKPEVAAQPLRIAPARVSPGTNRKWPSYARCVDGAPLNSEETGPDISRADFVFCMTAITWGWDIADTADRLMEESAKAQANGRGYAELTARNAALAVDRRKQQPRRLRPDQ
jgi:hypothetical protein